MKAHWWLTGLLTLAASAWTVLVPSQLDADPPARVGRLNYMSGSVSLRPAGSDQWSAAVPNRPLTTGDRLWTDTDSRAEVHVGSSVIRINAQTQLDFTNVDDRTLQLRLAQGSLTIRVRRLDDGQVYEIDAPNGAISLGRDGEYRVDVNADGTTSVVTVWSGDAEVTAAGSSFDVSAHQRASINGSDSPTYDLTDAPGYDAWDEWCVSRDRREDHSVSARYVSREMAGYEDLDEYGHWRSVAGYGDVWVPAEEPAGWAPYHNGHWVWVDPWGWTWVDDAPWGYAPYHYGRWAYVDGYWAWVPGRFVERPVYAPALVVFVGAPAPRPGLSLSIGFGSTVAWFALGPEEVYRPAYVTSPRYVQQVNITNVTNVTNITNVTNVTNVNNTTNVTNIQYRNRNAPGAIVATSTTAFASARPVQSAAVPVTTALRTAPVTGTAPAVVPTRASLAPVSTAAGAVKAPPAAVADRPVLAKSAPPPAPIPFAAKQQALATNGGKPLAPAQAAHIRQFTPTLAHSNTALVTPATTVPPGGGLRAARPGLPTAVTAAPGSGFGTKIDAAPRPTRVTTSATPVEPATPARDRVAQPPATGMRGADMRGTGTRVATGTPTTSAISAGPGSGGRPTTLVPRPPDHPVNHTGAPAATAVRTNTNATATAAGGGQGVGPQKAHYSPPPEKKTNDGGQTQNAPRNKPELSRNREKQPERR